MATDVQQKWCNRRSARDAVYRGFNDLAVRSGLSDSVVALRAPMPALEKLYAELAQAVSGEGLAELRALRTKWYENGGGGELPEDMLARKEP